MAADQGHSKAIEWVRSAADNGNSDDYEALTRLRVLANQGNSEAQYNLGQLYETGKTVSPSYSEALRWYRLSANQGNRDAQYSLGCMYAVGKGVKPDYSEALEWFRRAAEQGSSEAVKWFQRAAGGGNSEAQYNLGCMYAVGKGVKKDYSKALKWFRRAAEQGNSNGQYNIGCMYAAGKGVKQDYSEALKWYRLAANQGYTPAQFNIGIMYVNGYGVDEDLVEAAKWYRLASDQGYATAQDNLGFGHEVAQSYVEAVKALILARKYQNKRKVERAKAIVSQDIYIQSDDRQPIPDDVKMFVWQRDKGRCVKCGSNQNLEYDHIIPVSMGGSNTARNLQILCEFCNRSKGGNLF